jgi:hypothetical protein
MPNVVRVPSLRMTELDSSPDVQGVERIYLTNGFLSNLGGGSVLLSMSGSSSGAVTSTYASRPSAGSDGRLFLPSDGFYVERDTGSVWAPWGPLFPFTAVDNTAFSDFNTPTITTTNGGAYLALPSSASANYRGRIKAKTAPYTITAAFLVNMFPINFCAGFGLFFTDGTKIHAIGLGYDTGTTGGYFLASRKYNSATSFNANYSVTAYSILSPVVWLQISDDNTDRICRISADGINWIVFTTIGRTDFLTATSVGWGGDALNSQPAGLTLLSWKET